MPRAVNGDPSGNNRFSSRYVENAGFMRLQNVQIGYKLPSSILEKVNFDNFRIYLQGTNLMTVTDWSGVDPENDYIPVPKVVSIGLNASF